MLLSMIFNSVASIKRQSDAWLLFLRTQHNHHWIGIRFLFLWSSWCIAAPVRKLLFNKLSLIWYHITRNDVQLFRVDTKSDKSCYDALRVAFCPVIYIYCLAIGTGCLQWSSQEISCSSWLIIEASHTSSPRTTRLSLFNFWTWWIQTITNVTHPRQGRLQLDVIWQI